MSGPSPAVSALSESARRRRPATACISCRDRRVKCDHERPACFQCNKKGRECLYPDRIPTTVRFVTEPVSLATTLNTHLPQSSQTWRSVIEQQVDLVKKSNIKANAQGTGVPFWALAEVEEPTEEDRLRPINGVLPRSTRISALGEWFTTVLTPQLPSRETCQLFFDNFLVGVHPVCPVCHVPTLRQEYLDFWTDLSPETSVDSLVQVLAILYTGAANSVLASDIAQSVSLQRLYEDVSRAVDFDGYHVTSSSIQLLQGFVIMSTFRASQLSPFLAFGFLPRAIRFAQSLRFHMDLRFGSPIALEVRRRLWWHLVSLDVESTIASGLQCIIRPDGYTTGLPSIIRDDAILEDEAFPLLAGVSQPLSPMMVAMQGHWQWAQRIQTWFERMPDQNEVVHFSRLIENLLALISDCEANEWPRTYLKMQIDRAYCMLGLRFWQLNQFKGTDCCSEVVRTSRSFLQNYLQLSRLSVKQGLSWFVPGFIQPLHALVILLMHLSACSHLDDESQLSRNLVDEIFKLRVNHILRWSNVTTRAVIMGDEKDETSQKSNPRYRMLWNLRKRVWHKVGWRVPGHEGVQFGPPKDMPLREANEDLSGVPSSENPPQYHDGIEDNTMTAAFDNLLNSNPMDLLQWDEWESITSGFFVT